MNRKRRGVIMVGGASRRMGTAKACLPRGDGTQGAYLADLLQTALGSVPLLSGAGPAGVDLPRVPDREPGAGPLSGLLGLYDAHPDTDFLVLAVDLFAFDAAALAWLLQVAAETTRPALRPLLPGRAFGEPLAAVYTARAMPLLQASWAAGNRALKAALPPEAVAQPAVPAHLATAFCGANTPEELRALSARRIAFGTPGVE